MRTRQVASIWRAEWRALADSGYFWRFAALHLIAAAISVAVTWPTSIVFDAPAVPVTMNALVYTEAGILAYVAISLSAEIFAMRDKLGAIDWVYYGVATPAEVVVARLMWTGSVLASLVVLTLPLAIAAHSLFPIPASLIGGALAAVVTSLACFTAFGLIVSATFARRSVRVVVADSLFTLLAILIFLASGWFGSPGETRSFVFNPLGAIDYFLRAGGEPGNPFPWGAWILGYGILLAALLGLAYRKLWEWSPPADWGPRAPEEHREQGPRVKPSKLKSGSWPFGGDPR